MVGPLLRNFTIQYIWYVGHTIISWEGTNQFNEWLIRCWEILKEEKASSPRGVGKIISLIETIARSILQMRNDKQTHKLYKLNFCECSWMERGEVVHIGDLDSLHWKFSQVFSIFNPHY